MQAIMISRPAPNICIKWYRRLNTFIQTKTKTLAVHSSKKVFLSRTVLGNVCRIYDPGNAGLYKA
jgi:hypothetical protein